jgi:hypothetical protein
MFDHAGFSGVDYLLANANSPTDPRPKRGLLSALGLATSATVSALFAAWRGIVSRLSVSNRRKGEKRPCGCGSAL